MRAGWPEIALLSAVVAAAGCLTPPPSGVPASSTPKAAAEPVWPGRAPGELYAAGEVRAFELVQGGQRLGHSWGRYVGRDRERPDHHVFETRIELDIPGRGKARSAGRLVLDARGHLVEGYERSDAAELVFSRDGQLLRIRSGNQTDEVLYDPERSDVAVMAYSAVFHEELMLGLRTLAPGKLQWRLVSLSGSRHSEWSAEIVSHAGDEIVMDTSLGERLTLHGGRIVDIEVTATDLRVRALPEARWPDWSVSPPRVLAYRVPTDAAFELRELELPGKPDEPALSGELMLPKGGGGKHPAVLWIGTSGQEDRHGFAGPPPVDLGSHEITDALAQAGFAVLRFDERGKGESAPAELGFLAQLEDARRAYRTLVVQDEVDVSRVVLVGHGEGGLRALALAAERGDEIRGLALLGVPGRRFDAVLRSQSEALVAELPPELRAEARQQHELLVASLRKGGDVPPELAAQAKWIGEMLAVEPAKLVGRVRAELWIAQGEKDFEVDPQADPQALVAAAKRGKKKHALARYPGLDHLFKPEPGQSTPARYREDRRVDRAFIDDLVAWTRKVAGGR